MKISFFWFLVLVIISCALVYVFKIDKTAEKYRHSEEIEGDIIGDRKNWFTLPNSIQDYFHI